MNILVHPRVRGGAAFFLLSLGAFFSLATSWGCPSFYSRQTTVSLSFEQDETQRIVHLESTGDFALLIIDASLSVFSLEGDELSASPEDAALLPVGRGESDADIYSVEVHPSTESACSFSNGFSIEGHRQDDNVICLPEGPHTLRIARSRGSRREFPLTAAALHRDPSCPPSEDDELGVHLEVVE